MEYRRLGKTDLMVSSICLGTMTWGEQNSESEGHAQMDFAVDRGVNIFDTAELYPIPPKAESQGETEKVIGSWLKNRGRRSDIIVATKVVGRTENTWFRDKKIPGELNREQILEAVDKSLRRLGTDYIDLYQIHWPDRKVSQFGGSPTVWADADPVANENSIESTLEVLSELVKSGKVRHIGVSNESAWGTMSYLKSHESKNLPRIQSIQNAYSMLNRTFEVNLAEIARREKVGLLAYSALAQGYLTGKYADGALPKGSRKELYNRLQRYEKPGTDIAIGKYLKLAKKHGFDPGQLAIAFAHSRTFMTSVIIGATTMDQLKLNIDAAGIKVTPELENEINEIHQLHCNPAP